MLSLEYPALKSVEATNIANTIADAASPIWVKAIRYLRFTRSARTPAQGPRNRIGKLRIPTTVPVNNALPPVIRNISHPTVKT